MAGMIKAVLGPTNTGKTHYAVERMLGYSSGLMGFPLRLLAREVYDRVVAVKGKNQVALLTGEERIMPEGARYFMCTAEAMPRDKLVDFVAIDEIQMAADPQRGHIFTEHLLHTRGRFETLFLGASTMRTLIQRLVPDAELIYRERFSNLSYVPPSKLSRLPNRSVLVGFSADDVYGMAELLKRHKGGAAIVMGGLSPRTRNAQVEMYQAGEVDHLVATDAIGMGLNLDVDHVAFSSLTKFDGRTFRELTAAEAAQIAGRAGRYKNDGTFSTVGGRDSELMTEAMVTQIEEHQFAPVKSVFWRNRRLNFTTIPRLLRSLEEKTDTQGLMRSPYGLDLAALKNLAEDDEIFALADNKDAVTRLWNICQIPDFRKVSPGEHYSMLRRIFVDLMGPGGTIPHDWFAAQVKRLDNMDGEIDTLAGRIANIRTWTYVSHRKDWLTDAAHWAHVTRSVENRLSDALHEKLTQRFVDRRTAVLMRSLRQKDALRVSIDSETNTVSVEGHEIGDLNGFSFKVDPASAGDEQKVLKAAAEQGLKIELTRRAKIFANVGFKTLEFDFSEGLDKPVIIWDGAPIATLHDSGALFGPRIKLLASTLLMGENADLVREKTQEWLDTRIAERMDPLVKLAQELNGEIEAPEGAVALSGLARGVAFRLVEHYGVMGRAAVDADLRQLDQEARKGLRRFGIRIGASSLYMPFVMKPHATELRLAMWAMAGKIEGLPKIPTPGMVWVEIEEGAPDIFYELAGFKPCGKKAVRMDMLERLADAVRPLGSAKSKGGDGWFEVSPETMGLVGLSGEDFAGVMKTAGYKFEIRQITKAKPEAGAVPEATPEAGTETAPEATEKASDRPEAEAVPAAKEDSAESASSESAPESTPAPATEPAIDLVVAEKDTPAEEAAKAPAEATAPAEDTATEPEASDEATAEDALVDRYFFAWVPKRKARPQGRRPQPSGDDAKEGDRKPRGKGKLGDKSASGGRRDFSSKRRAGGNQPGKGAQPNRGGKPSRPPKREKLADPDSPFAALAGLKATLEKKK